MQSQEHKILEFLKARNRLTPLEALNRFGCLRLSGRILDLRKKGYDIKTEIVEENGKRFAEYSL